MTTFPEKVLFQEADFPRVRISKFASFQSEAHPHGIEPGFEYEGHLLSPPVAGEFVYVRQGGREFRSGMVQEVISDQPRSTSPETGEVKPRTIKFRTARSAYKIEYFEQSADAQ